MKFGKDYFDYCKSYSNFDMNDISEWHNEYFDFLQNVFHRLKYDDTISLDVGCATGGYLEMFRKHGMKMFGCDMSKWYIENSKFPLIKDLMGVIENNKIPFEDNKFDFVHMGQVIEHIPEEFIIEELTDILRTMKKSGILYISTVGEGPKIPEEGEDLTHIACFSEEKWNGIFEKVGFINNSIKYRRFIKEDPFASQYDWVNFVLVKD